MCSVACGRGDASTRGEEGMVVVPPGSVGYVRCNTTARPRAVLSSATRAGAGEVNRG